MNRKRLIVNHKIFKALETSMVFLLKEGPPAAVGFRPKEKIKITLSSFFQFAQSFSAS